MIWVKVEEISLKEDVIFLPQSIASQLEAEVSISFGQKRIWAQVSVLPSFMELGGEKFEKPQKIQIATCLWKKLLLVESIHLQMKIENREIKLGPVMGLLLGNKNYRYSIAHMEKYSDRFGIYPEIGGLIYAFSTETIDWQKKSVYGLYHNYFKGEWEYGVFPLPSVVYRRHFHSKEESLERLKEITDGKVFNSERLSKWELYEKLKDNKALKEFIPQTVKVKSFKDVTHILTKYKNVILKPSQLSRGRGICIIESIKDDSSQSLIDNSSFLEKLKSFPNINKGNKKFLIFDYRNHNPLECYTVSSDMLKIFVSEEFSGKYYLIQPLLSLAKAGESLFDIRIVMQKDERGQWVHSGTECRVADSGKLITNISLGGYALSLKAALQKAFGPDVDDKRIEEKILQFCQQFCQAMDQTGEHYAEFGIDVAIDTQKKLWFIEANVFPSFKGFKKMDYDTYLTIRYRPLLYGAKLSGFGRGED